jgi:hypothetical protein
MKQVRSLTGTMNCRCSAVGSGLPLTGQRFGACAYSEQVERVTRRTRRDARKVAVFFIEQR